MSRIFGIVNYREKVIFDITSLEKNENVMSYKYNDALYTIVYNGTLYNAEELKNELQMKGFEIETNLDVEILLKAYVCFGKDLCRYLNGVFVFAIWNEKEKELFLARDHFGIKPLYYSINDERFIFASEIKAILNMPGIEAKMDVEGIGEVLGLGPAHTVGKTPFKNIFELEPAHFIVFKENNLYKKEYWKLETKPHTDDFNITCDNIRNLIIDSTKRRLSTNENTGVLLSGGLDSSIITAIASEYYNEKGRTLDTFSVDYKDNDKNFVSNEYQPNSDNYYIDIMTDKFKTNHTKILLDTPELYDTLRDAMLERDFPGMADVDSSYLLLFKEFKNFKNVALSGECSDEIFGGYPWYFKDEKFNTFPWSTALDERQKLLKTDISSRINIKEYVSEKYNESIKKVEVLEEDSIETKEHRKLTYLTLNWFMNTLIDRTDRMSKYSDVDVRVPFCDYRLIEYAWNIPWEMKAYKGREKGLLRKAMEGYLPEEVIYRKKSPYPKTHNPNYLQKVKGKLREIIENKNSRIHQLINVEYVKTVIDVDGKNFKKPWFGQLMTGPQFMAYLIQLEMWLDLYDIKVET